CRLRSSEVASDLLLCHSLREHQRDRVSLELIRVLRRHDCHPSNATSKITRSKSQTSLQQSPAVLRRGVELAREDQVEDDAHDGACGLVGGGLVSDLDDLLDPLTARGLVSLEAGPGGWAVAQA